jgi:hypothetical protein
MKRLPHQVWIIMGNHHGRIPMTVSCLLRMAHVPALSGTGRQTALVSRNPCRIAGMFAGAAFPRRLPIEQHLETAAFSC